MGTAAGLTPVLQCGSMVKSATLPGEPGDAWRMDGRS